MTAATCISCMVHRFFTCTSYWETGNRAELSIAQEMTRLKLNMPNFYSVHIEMSIFLLYIFLHSPEMFPTTFKPTEIRTSGQSDGAFHSGAYCYINQERIKLRYYIIKRLLGFHCFD